MDKKLALQYALKQKNKKKMAQGGEVKDQSAKTEARPMPSTKVMDAKMVNKAPQKPMDSEGQWTDQPTVKQAQKPSIVPMSRPKLRGSDTFSVRYREEIDQDNHRMQSEAPDGYGKQPKEAYNEKGANRQGPDLHKQRFAEGGRINNVVSFEDSEEDNAEHPAGLESSDSSKRPPEDEYMADHFARGGYVDENDQPQPEAEEEHHASIAAAIMARDKKKFAEGGYVDIEQNAQEDDAGGEMHRRNHEILKENYDSDFADLEQPWESNRHAIELSDENEMSKVSKILRRMSAKNPMGK